MPDKALLRATGVISNNTVKLEANLIDLDYGEVSNVREFALGIKKILRNHEAKVAKSSILVMLRYIQSLIFRFRWIKTKVSLSRAGFEVNQHWKNPESSDVPIDVIIVVVEKDLITLPEVIESLRLRILHPIENIYIVSPKSEKIACLCDEYKCTNIDEDDVLNLKKSDINFKVTGKDYFGLDRSGWIFQQLLKLSSDTVSDQDHILIVDADTIFTSPQVFIRDNKWIFNLSDERHRPYHNTNKKLTNRSTFDVSFISHHILFNRNVLQQIKSGLSKKFGLEWEQCILSALDRSIACPFSEYEFYGNYVMNEVAKENFIFEYWENKSFSRARWPELEYLKRQAYKRYKTISFHQHL